MRPSCLDEGGTHGERDMRNVRGTRHSLPNTRTLTIIAQDPSVKIGGRIVTTNLEVPAEDLLPGPCGYRVNVIDFDAATNTLYEPATFRDGRDGTYVDPFAAKSKGKRSAADDKRLLTDPRFHA